MMRSIASDRESIASALGVYNASGEMSPMTLPSPGVYGVRTPL